MAVKLPNVETGVRLSQFEDVLRDYVRVRAQEYYKWKDYQYAIKYADSNYYINRVDDFIDEVSSQVALSARIFHLIILQTRNTGRYFQSTTIPIYELGTA
jgi:hypothetical protein